MTGSRGLAAALLIDAERERFEGMLRWHFNVVADQGKGSSYASLGVANATNDVERILADRLARLADPATVEAVAERISWDGGDMQRWREDAHHDHNFWTWRGDGHGDVMRQAYRTQAEAALAVVRGLLGGTGGEG